MTRQKKSGSAPKRTKQKRTNVATRLPKNPQALYTRCTAIWQAVKADTAHFASPYPPAAQVEGDLTTLGTALQAAEGGDSAAKAAVIDRRAEGPSGLPAAPRVRAGGPAGPAAGGGAADPREHPDVREPGRHAGAQAPAGDQAGDALGQRDPERARDPRRAHVPVGVQRDQVNWTVFGRTGQAQVTIAGLTPGKVYYFRCNAFQRDGTSTEYVIAGPFMVT